MNAFEELLNLILPTPCCGCNKPGSVLCQTCLTSLVGSPRRVHRNNFEGWAFCEFDDLVSRTLHSFKEGGQTRVAAILAAKMGPLLDQFHDGSGDPRGLILVSVPSRSQSFVKRGFVPARVLTQQLARRGRFRSVAALKFSRLVEDQAGLGLVARQTNLVNSMTAKFSMTGFRVLIIDDIVTTGATLLEAKRALELAGAEVVGFLAFAETMLKTSTGKHF